MFKAGSDWKFTIIISVCSVLITIAGALKTDYGWVITIISLYMIGSTATNEYLLSTINQRARKIMGLLGNVEGHLKDTKKNNESVEKHLRGFGSQVTLTRIQDTHPELFWFSKQLQWNYERLIREVIHPDNLLWGEMDYFPYAIERISGLKPGDRVLALCQSPYEQDRTRNNYYQANFDAASRGVKIERIMLEQFVFDGSILSLMDEHVERGIFVGKIPFNRACKIIERCHIPMHFGFLIVLPSGRDRGYVLVHFGRDDLVGLKLRSPFYLHHFQVFYQKLRSAATPHESNTQAA